ncbi:hypothetical protein DSCO28_46280 [Desulfosarcina ovata subsp. sediminis]|uniref:Ferrous iron transporter FeoA-like domain-containing protein n=1 Tax=Desulfosarcina ovata subsp. sediminis TaxID=885957 RepID=A0A5K7ZUZ3_9BACT|nr:FeoA family protein [Desulfosarcina ovata]BBO84062.1 hypothetical protein DSCO28_46280 [Desulfosarcina ovata subsp. sediminis]
MKISLTHAPFDRQLIISDITEAGVETLLSRLGLFRGDKFVREDEEVLLHPVRLRGEKGEVVLGGGMATRVIVHLDDGRRMPLTDMRTGQRGHIEGTTCSANLTEALNVLGLNEDEEVVYLRQLPSMDYTVAVGKSGRTVSIQEGMAAKIWGRIGERRLQFVSAGKGQPFFVEKILGGLRSTKALEEKGIAVGHTINLEAVAPAQIFNMAVQEAVVISTDDGLHLHLRPGQAERILVEPMEP